MMNNKRPTGSVYAVKNDDRRTETACNNRTVGDVRSDAQSTMSSVDQRDKNGLTLMQEGLSLPG